MVNDKDANKFGEYPKYKKSSGIIFLEIDLIG
jgi:hypothetical protein